MKGGCMPGDRPASDQTETQQQGRSAGRTGGDAVRVDLVQTIVQGQHLHSAQRVQQVRVVPLAAAEAAVLCLPCHTALAACILCRRKDTSAGPLYNHRPQLGAAFSVGR